jgi:RecJ-like exonuclease
VFLALRYTILGALFGLSGGIAYSLLMDTGFEAILDHGPAWLLAGLFLGMIVGVPTAILGSPRMVFEYNRQVIYKLARCAWCRGSGRNFFIFPCRVCRGNGHVLTVEPKQKCAWCHGHGKEFFVFRCRVCDGTGWAYGLFDKKK